MSIGGSLNLHNGLRDSQKPGLSPELVHLMIGYMLGFCSAALILFWWF